jgi:hypothetical protein
MSAKTDQAPWAYGPHASASRLGACESARGGISGGLIARETARLAVASHFSPDYRALSCERPWPFVSEGVLPAVQRRGREGVFRREQRRLPTLAHAGEPSASPPSSRRAILRRMRRLLSEHMPCGGRRAEEDEVCCSVWSRTNMGGARALLLFLPHPSRLCVLLSMLMSLQALRLCAFREPGAGKPGHRVPVSGLDLW